MANEQHEAYTWPPAITAICPDGRYQYHEAIGEAFAAADVPTLWVPYAPVMEAALDSAGFEHVVRLDTDDLRFGVKRLGNRVMDLTEYTTSLVDFHVPQAAVVESRARAERGLEWRSFWLQPKGYTPPEPVVSASPRRVPPQWLQPVIGRRT